MKIRQDDSKKNMSEKNPTKGQEKKEAENSL